MSSLNAQLATVGASNPRNACWSTYRERALAAGKDFLNAIDLAVPTIRERRFESEAQGRVTDESMQAMVNAGVFRTFTPLQYGGL